MKLNIRAIDLVVFPSDDIELTTKWQLLIQLKNI